MNSILNREIHVSDLGLIDYQKAWDHQTSLFNSILEVKKNNRLNADRPPSPTPNYLLFCEHPHVFTLGNSGDEKHLLIARERLSSIDAAYYHTNRGGDITYHGPGQIVVYPVIDLENFFTDIHRYMRTLEEAVIRTLHEFSIPAGRIQGLTGVWIDPEKPQARKIAALGVKTSRWVTLHGLAFNVNPDLSYFSHIVACGIPDKPATSMEKELNKLQDMTSVKEVLKGKLIDLFEMKVAVAS